ncbi:hypothetical protein LUZ60_013444 [Juncus effusus]|nr:hypothetical protein LUZ60_013444 [Juncus effusus]
MLLLDGCFILELFFKWLDEDPDGLFKEGWGPTTIFSDLLLFENQIPFFVVERLYGLVMTGETTNNRDAFLSLFAKFLMDEEPSHTTLVTWPERIHRMLDHYHHFLVPGQRQTEGTNGSHNSSPLWKRRLVNWITPRPNQRGARRPLCQIPCATELYEAGVIFTKKLSPNNLFDVKFERGVLQIPPLSIDSNQKTLLTNLVALEKHKTWGGQTVTSYVALMDSLINTKDDVALLQHTGIIHNMLSSHQEAAIFFNRLGDVPTLPPFLSVPLQRKNTPTQLFHLYSDPATISSTPPLAGPDVVSLSRSRLSPPFAWPSSTRRLDGNERPFLKIAFGPLKP